MLYEDKKHRNLSLKMKRDMLYHILPNSPKINLMTIWRFYKEKMKISYKRIS